MSSDCYASEHLCKCMHAADRGGQKITGIWKLPIEHACQIEIKVCKADWDLEASCACAQCEVGPCWSQLPGRNPAEECLCQIIEWTEHLTSYTGINKCLFNCMYTYKLTPLDQVLFKPQSFSQHIVLNVPFGCKLNWLAVPTYYLAPIGRTHIGCCTSKHICAHRCRDVSYSRAGAATTDYGTS